MKKICSYCRVGMDDIPPLDDGRVTHGMCDKCTEYFVNQWKGLSLNDYLDAFKKPVFVVDSDRRMIACNRQAEGLLGVGEEASRGLRVGEFMECEHARLPEGCGRTVHCRDCQLRISIARTIETGTALVNVPAYQAGMVNGLPVTRWLNITTSKIGDAVAVTIEGMENRKEAGK